MPQTPNPSQPTPKSDSDSFPELTIPQIIALEALTSGGSITAAALSADVTRATLRSWLKPPHPFATAFHDWKATLTESTCARVTLMADAASVQIYKAIQNGDLAASFQVAKATGCLAPQPIGPTLAHIRAKLLKSQL